jgi:hypothetical protein
MIEIYEFCSGKNPGIMPVSKIWHFGDTSDEMSGIQQTKIIADKIRISYS